MGPQAPQKPSSADLAKSLGGSPSSQLAAALGGTPGEAPPAPQAAPQATNGGDTWSTLVDVAKGAGKALGRSAIDTLNFAGQFGNPGLTLQTAMGQKPPIPRPEVLESANDTQRYSGYATDLATSLIPGGSVGKSSRLVPALERGGGWLLRKAVPELTEKAAEQVLSRGKGIITQGSAKALAAEAKATPQISTTVVQRAGKWVPKEVKPSKLQPAADAMTKAAAQPMKSMTSAEVATTLGGMPIFLHSPEATAAIGLASLLSRPLPRSVIAQGVHSLAPAAGAMAGGVGALGVQTLLKLLGGGGNE